jgi:hypothetical protein
MKPAPAAGAPIAGEAGGASVAKGAGNSPLGSANDGVVDETPMLVPLRQVAASQSGGVGPWFGVFFGAGFVLFLAVALAMICHPPLLDHLPVASRHILEPFADLGRRGRGHHRLRSVPVAAEEDEDPRGDKIDFERSSRKEERGSEDAEPSGRAGEQAI